MKKSPLPKGWRWFRLRELGTIVGGGTPSRRVREYYTGAIPWVTIKDLKEGVFEIGDAQEHITEEAIKNSATNLIEPGAVIIATRVGLGKVAVNTAPLAINQDLKAFRPNINVNPNYIALLIHRRTFDLLKYGQGTTVKGIRQDDLLDMNIPLPPLPVQERIVAILQKADEVRRKKQSAIDINDAVLPASFNDMFGHTEEILERFGSKELSRLAEIRSGVTKGRKLQGHRTVEVPYLRVANVQDGYLDLSEIKTIKVLPSDVEKYHLEDGDILMTEGGDPDKLGRGSIWRNEKENCIHQNHIFRVRTDRSQILPEFLAALLRTHYAKSYFLRSAKRSSNLASINTKQVKSFLVPTPPIALQQKFVSVVEQWNRAAQTLKHSYRDTANLFTSLLNAAFNGELTAEWEGANADFIIARQSLYERLPQLLLLAFLQERSVRANKNAADATLLVTALMKYVFLFQMEATTRRRLYHFIPYHYGPFAKELYSDLNALREKGFITINNGDDVRTRITLTDSGEVEAAFSELPTDIKEDVTTIVETYGDLNHSELLDVVYEKYPTYAQKSRLKAKASIKK